MSPTDQALFSPVRLGELSLPNRLVMAPMTRGRASPSGVPGALVAEYYRQRASVGLIITEGTYPDPTAQAYVGQPGIVSAEQVAGWTDVAQSVHDAGGRILLQLMHAGRAAHPDLNGGLIPVAPSALSITGAAHVPAGKRPYATPRALSLSEIDMIISGHVDAARRAIGAGFDGVELHAANGYLLHQFLAASANHRTDLYGQTPQNRARLAVEIAAEIARAVGAGRVGIRVSPGHAIHDIDESETDDVVRTYEHLAEALRPLGLAYLSVLHPNPAGGLVQSLRRAFRGPLIVNTGFSRITTKLEAASYVATGAADAVAVGRPLISNPDLLYRWEAGYPETPFDPRSSYGSSSIGYTDYPKLIGRSALQHIREV